jgi:hypothetical protein
MRRTRMKVRNAAIAMSAVATAVALAGCSDDTHGDEQTLKLTEAEARFHPVGDPWPEANKPGGGFTQAARLADYSSGKNAGELNAVCIFTQGNRGRGGEAQCTGTADVPGGELVLDVGEPAGGEKTSGAIIGGTGKYAGATGTFESVQQGDGTALDTFNITLP